MFKKKKASRLFLGAIVVVPRSQFMKIDEWGIFKGENLEDSVKDRLEKLFELPLVNECESFGDDDLELEIVVSKLQGGEFTSVLTSPIDIPIMWRPKIQIKARLSFINSKKTKQIFDVSQKMPWKEYFGRVFSFRGIVRIKPLFEAVDLEPMLYRACQQLVNKLAKCV